MRLNRAFGFLSLALALSASALPGQPMPITPPGKPAPPSGVNIVPEVTTLPRSALPVVVPAGSVYVCVSETGNVRRETAIEFSPKVGALCAKHPEMGPCQYERNTCRRSGGRVYAAGGVEITLQMEADYDQKVMRVRIK